MQKVNTTKYTFHSQKTNVHVTLCILFSFFVFKTNKNKKQKIERKKTQIEIKELREMCDNEKNKSIELWTELRKIEKEKTDCINENQRLTQVCV